MARTRTIVGIGEALLCEHADRVEPGGLAVLIAGAAARLGHTGMAISRIGQDRAGDELIQGMIAHRLDTAHIQTDPDLPTGRLAFGPAGGQTGRTMTARAAFDNLQWDFDLVDVAQQTDAAVFGTLARRDGQSRSVMKQFLAECTSAVRVFDLTNRADSRLDRVEIRSGFELAEGAAIDRTAAKALAPGWSTTDLGDAAAKIRDEWGLMFVAVVERNQGGQTLAISTIDGTTPPSPPFPPLAHESALVGMLHGLLAGWDHVRCVECASKVASFAADHPGQPMPAHVLA